MDSRNRITCLFATDYFYIIPSWETIRQEEQVRYVLPVVGVCDVKVSAYAGYNSPRTFTASSTVYCYIVVEPYSEGNSGYCAIKVTEN